MSSGYAVHNQKMISVFEVIGSYFVDTLFNHTYINAKANLRGDSSLTDEYVRCTQAYMMGIKNDQKCYSAVVADIHTYFTKMTSYSTLSFGNFVDRVVSLCIPEEYFSDFDNTSKDQILSSVLCDLVSNLVAFTTRPDMLRRIIDAHTVTPSVTIRMMQDAAVNILVTKRSELHNKFLIKKGQARETVSMDVVEGMKEALRKLAKEKSVIMAKINKLESDNGQLKDDLHDTRTKLAKALQIIKLMKVAKTEGEANAGLRIRAQPKDLVAEATIRREAQAPPKREHIAEVERTPTRAPPKREHIAESKRTRRKRDTDSESSVSSAEAAPIEADFFSIAKKNEPTGSGDSQASLFNNISADINFDDDE